MKTLGILGGVGPETTSEVYLSVIALVKKRKESKYPPIVIYNLPFPFIIESEAISKGINSQKMLPYLIKGAKILEKAGADFGILPCNTLHKHIGEIRNAVKIPFLSILEETLLKLKSLQVNTVGILATQTTVDSKIYNEILEKNGLKIIYPTITEQNRINHIILKLLNGENKKHNKEIEKICLSLIKRGSQRVLLACTDLQLLPLNKKIPIVDTTDVLIKASVRELGNKK